jgi:predicted ferric reductase
MTVLEIELEFFTQHKDEWLRYYKGQFALVKGEELIGTFTTRTEAFSAGIGRLGNVPFLIKVVSEEEETVQFPALTVGMINAHP